MYHEGLKMIGLQDEDFKQFEGLRTTRVNHSIWRINKELDKVLVQKVFFLFNNFQKVEDYRKFEPKTTLTMRMIKNFSMLFSIIFYILIHFLSGEYDETLEMVIYIFYGKFNKDWLFYVV